MEKKHYEPVYISDEEFQVKEIITDSKTDKVIEENIIDESHPIFRIVNEYLNALEIFSGMEVEAAPSGEWAEYNYQYMIQENIVQTYEEVLGILGYDYSLHYEEDSEDE